MSRVRVPLPAPFRLPFPGGRSRAACRAAPGRLSTFWAQHRRREKKRMAIFRRETESPSPAASGGSSDSQQHAAARRRVTHIAPGTRLKGEITGATEVLVDGEVEGEIR